MRDRNKELQAIELGKEWMRNSKNTLHDYTHAQNVAEHSLKVLESLRGDVTIDENIALLAAWWHDCYKATMKMDSLYSVFFEGKESEKIMRREVAGLVSEEVLDKVGEMIRNHNIPAPFFVLFRRNYTLNFRVLYEADYIEGFNPDRMALAFSIYNFFLKIFFKVYYVVYPFFMNLLPQSEYLKNYLRTRK
jgi:hypothetical protein